MRGLPIGPGPGVGYFGNKPIQERGIPEAEQESIQRVISLANDQRRPFHIVDVGKESVLRRVIEEHLHHLHRFPVLVRPDGRRLEGTENFTSENLAEFLSD